MKRNLIIITCFLLVGFISVAQRYAVIDSKYILEKLSDYKESQARLDQFSNQWQQEIEKSEDASFKLRAIRL